MARPCTCDRIPPKGEPYIKGQHCRRCWRYHNDDRYKNKWDAVGPSIIKKAGNFIVAAVKHLSSGMKKLCDDEYQKRIDVCDSCEKKVGDNCLECGCVLSIKARWASEDCPLGRWPLQVIDNKVKECNCKQND